MVKTFNKPWHGVAIPSIIIAVLGYGSQLLIFSKFPLGEIQYKLFNLELIALWVAYFIAIVTPPGTPRKDAKPQVDSHYKVWENYCEKCQCQKPERTHHCKTCNTCVLAMDHHCPWTMNCVGLYNFASFLRFLLCIIVATSTLLWHLGKHCHTLYQFRNSVSTKVTFFDVTVLFIMTGIDFLVLFTITALFLRCVNNEFIKGMTQIETWEMDRLESLALNDKLMPIVLMNVSVVFDIDISKNEQWAVCYYNLLRKSKRWFVNDYVSFPYDRGFLENLTSFMGPFYSWIIPWGKSHVNLAKGFPKNDIALLGKREAELSIDDNHLMDLILSLPWPPEGLKQDKLNEKTDEFFTLLRSSLPANFEANDKYLQRSSRVVDRRLDLNRNEWYNEDGEDLAYFGVDEY